MTNFEQYKDALKGVTFIDLFAGIGGFHTALSAFGAECVFASEWDKHAQTTYFANYNMQPNGDITEIEAEDIPPHDILCAGFPCQPFSISGLRKGFEDTRGTLFFDVARIASFHQPKILFMENVRNFATHENGNTLETVRETLQQLGYTLSEKVLNASHFGLPQNRERIYMIAVRNDIELERFTFPNPTNEVTKLLDYILPDEETAQYIIKRDDMVIDESKIPTLSLLNEYPNKPVRVGTINKGGQGERIYSDYGHAITLSAQGGGPGSKTGCYLINGRVRKLAPRECARIQGFPEHFKIPVTDTQAWKQFGNSVPVTVLKHIVVKFIETEAIYDALLYEKLLLNEEDSPSKMAKTPNWKLFEQNACKYLNDKLKHLKVTFKNTGGSNSTSNDILAYYENDEILSIEAKYSPSQSGQFVVKIEDDKFELTTQQKSKANQYTAPIIEALNADLQHYIAASVTLADVQVDNALLVAWVKEHYANKGVSYIITSHEVDGYKAIIPLVDFGQYFDVSAVLRPKQSGTSYVSKSNFADFMLQLAAYAEENNITVLDVQEGKKPYVILDRASLPKSSCYIGDRYLLSEADEPNKYYLKQRATTRNLNVVFSVKYKGEKNNYGLQELEQYIRNVLKK